jgi:hypothetical protein
MLTNENIDKFNLIKNANIIQKNKERKIIIKKNNLLDNFFYTDKNCDQLIWYYHILINGYQTYHFMGNNSYQEETKIKMDLVYKVRDNKQILKNNKIKYREVESNLCNDKYINLNTFLALLIISKINFYYTSDKFYYSLLINPDLDSYCYLHKKEDKYYLWEKEVKPEFESISNKLITIDNINKPLKSISSYKKPELEEICKKLKIKYEYVGQKKFTKNKLYALIQENI